jgi:LCP family protein required for cell wall assembly
MSLDRTEQLIRDAFADEAARAVDAREVLAGVRRKRPRRNGLVLAAAAVVVVVAAVAAFVVPEVFERSAPPAADRQTPTRVEKNVLVVGMAPGDLTDSVVLTRLHQDGSVDLVSLPRDTWVRVPGNDMRRLNGVYREFGVDALLATVATLTGAPVDQYVLVGMGAIAPLTDAVGGVEVCLRAPTEDEFAGADFAAGPQVLTGDAALAFVRQRRGLPNGSLDRDVRLQVFLRSLAVELRDADESALAAALAATGEHVRDSGDLDLLGFAVDLTQASALRVGTIPVTDTAVETPENGLAIGVDPTEVRRFVGSLPGTPPVTGDVPCVW